jgi:hypothetical protein
MHVSHYRILIFSSALRDRQNVVGSPKQFPADMRITLLHTNSDKHTCIRKTAPMQRCVDRDLHRQTIDRLYAYGYAISGVVELRADARLPCDREFVCRRAAHRLSDLALSKPCFRRNAMLRCVLILISNAHRLHPHFILFVYVLWYPLRRMAG